MELLQLAPETLNYHCPFNTSHCMPHKTLIKHLVKCPDRPSNFRNCTFNIQHIMPQSELEAHEKTCPNKVLVDSVIYESEDIIRPIPVIKNAPKMEYDESWDDITPSNDVLRNINKTTITMKAKHGSTKSERKKYRTLLHDNDEIEQNNLKKEVKVPKNESKKQVESKPFFIGKRPSNI